MPAAIFVNLPVTNLPAARQFYTALGYAINESFSDDTGACVVISDSIYAMILTHGKFAKFTSLPIGDARATRQHMLALSFHSKAEVDTFVAAGLANGGSEPRPTQDLGFMYSRALADPDGHIWEPFWMDPAAASAGPPDTAE